jgi:DNA-binding NarL/FixJ family response regulator
MQEKIRVAILDDHQSIIDGYNYRLSHAPEIEVVATAMCGEELEPLLSSHPVDVLLLDVLVPTSPSNRNPYPILHLIPKLLQTYPNLSILVMSMHAQRSLIRAVVEAGASGYILKDDQTSIRELAAVIRMVASGGIHFSPQAHAQLLRNGGEGTLTPRQQEVLSLAAAYPDLTSAQLASTLGIAQSTARNLLSGAYLRLGVRSRSAAIAKARHLGLITPPDPSLQLLNSE